MGIKPDIVIIDYVDLLLGRKKTRERKDEIDDIYITDASTVSSTIKDVEGGSVKFILENGITYNTLNSLFFPRNGEYLRFSNIIETPTSSKNGYFKNTLTFKKYKEFKSNLQSYF